MTTVVGVFELFVDAIGVVDPPVVRCLRLNESVCSSRQMLEKRPVVIWMILLPTIH